MNPDALGNAGRDRRSGPVNPVAKRLALLLPMIFLPAHAVVALASHDPNASATLIFETMAPLIAGIACIWRASLRRGRARHGWLAVGVAMLCWTAGIGSQLFEALTISGGTGNGAISMLLFVLYGVPLTFVLASPGSDPWPVRLVDGMSALILGALFSAYIFSFVPLAGTQEDTGLFSLALMFDLQNIFIAIFALIRYRASSIERERQLFGILTAFGFAYMFAAGCYNHLVDGASGIAPVSLMVALPFMLLAVLALRANDPARAPPAGRIFERVVMTASPLTLPVSLLAVSAALVPQRPVLAIVGCAAATLGYGLRAILAQLRAMDERDRLAQLSHFDALTGLPNRRQFDEALRRELTRAARSGHGLALLMIDIDHFKLLNDTLGHRVGDDRLRDVAEALQSCLEAGSGIVTRYGGEEFAVILPGAVPADALARAEAMRAAVEALALASPSPMGCVTVSIGAARLAKIDSDAGQRLVERADHALYDSKHAGRNRVTAAWPVEDGVQVIPAKASRGSSV